MATVAIVRPWPLPHFDPAVGWPLVAWMVTTTAGVILFAVLLRGGSIRAEVPGSLSVLVMDGRRGSGRWAPLARPSDSTLVGTAAPTPTAAGDGSPGGLAGPAQRPGPERGGGPRRPPIRFGSPPKAGIERRTIAYQRVRVSAGPDHVRFPEIARVDRRDEVEVVGEQDGYLKVRLPDGTEGWVPRVVVVGSSTTQIADPAT